MSNQTTIPLPSRLLAVITVAVSFGFGTLGCGGTGGEGPPDDPAPAETIVTGKLENYAVRTDPGGMAVPFNEYFSLQVDVLTAEANEPAPEADIELEVFVESFGKSMPTSPDVTRLEGGTYRVDGMLLTVPRLWEMKIDVDGPAGRDVVRVPLDPVASLPTVDPSEGRFSKREIKRILTFSPEDMSLPASPSNAYADDPKAAHLGRFLFFDNRLSSNNAVSCSTCHLPSEGFGDGKKLAEGVGQTPRHAPTVLNAAYSRWFFWDGRVDSLWAQALQPIEAPKEHGFDRLSAVRHIADDEELNEAYREVFGSLPDLKGLPDSARPVPGNPEATDHQNWMSIDEQRRREITRAYANIGKAIAAYERKIVRLKAPFDRYVDGLRTGDTAKLSAISEEAKEGLKLFVDQAECDLCHSGSQFTDSEFHTLGLGTQPWLPDDDAGRGAGASQVIEEEFNAAGDFSDAPEEALDHLNFLATDRFAQKGAFKTPTLRNVTDTAPYMHGGHFDNLREVVEFYADLQRDPPVGRRSSMIQPLELSDEEIEALVAFMETLTGEPLPETLKSAPETPIPPESQQ